MLTPKMLFKELLRRFPNNSMDIGEMYAMYELKGVDMNKEFTELGEILMRSRLKQFCDCATYSEAKELERHMVEGTMLN
jgi:hypothetical protein